MGISRRTALGFIAGNEKATERVYGEYKNLMFFVIAHRLSTIKHCDRISVMEGGKFIEDGTFEELIEKGGLFAELVERQRLDKIE